MLAIPLPADVYYRLRYLQADAENVAYRAKLEMAAAHERFLTALRAAGEAHGFDPNVDHAWNDADTALIPPAPTKEPQQ